jgi:1-acyl-sn-glycerol-3-phosphate acyltransferase
MVSPPTLHTVSVAEFIALPVQKIIDALPRFLASYVIPDPDVQQAVIAEIAQLQTTAPRAEWEALVAHLKTLGEDYGFYHRDALAEKVAEGYMIPLLEDSSTIAGLEFLDQAVALADSGRRVMIVGNHLSYADTMALRSLLSRRGRHDAVSRLTAVAGPKVYAEPMRRLAVAGIHSIKVAQSSTLSTNEQEPMSPRELVRISRSCMRQAEESMDVGRFVLIYPEGTRSRDTRLQPFVRATNRWLTLPDVVLLPIALWGTEALYLLDSDQMRPAECHAEVGAPIDTAALKAGGAGRDEIMQVAHAAIAAMLPAEYQPPPGSPFQS